MLDAELGTLGLGAVTFAESRESSVTTNWGVDWDEVMIARDLMQNFYDANRERLSLVRVLVSASRVDVTAPAKFNLSRLFYLGSEKGPDDIGQYGEGFKAASACLLRDFGVEPVVASGPDLVRIRVDQRPVQGTQLRPVVYDYFRLHSPIDGTQLILRGCSVKLTAAMRVGLDHFFHEQHPDIGEKLWEGRDGTAVLYRSRSADGHAFYRRLRRAKIPGIPIVAVLNKESASLEKLISKDRDRNAFGDKVLEKFYEQFAAQAAYDQALERAIVTLAQPVWSRGHPLLATLARKSRHHWSEANIKRVFGDRYFAHHHDAWADPARTSSYESIEKEWIAAGRTMLPRYFAEFGLMTPQTYLKALEARDRDSKRRSLTVAESECVGVLREVLRQLSPATVAHFSKADTRYEVAETEFVLGELRRGRSYRAKEVFFAASIFAADFPDALAVFLHEHAHVFGHDGSRGFGDAMTDLLATVVRERGTFPAFIKQWDAARAGVLKERQKRTSRGAPTPPNQLSELTLEELRAVLAEVPVPMLTRLLAHRKRE